MKNYNFISEQARRRARIEDAQNRASMIAARYAATAKQGDEALFDGYWHLGLNCLDAADGRIYKAAKLYALVNILYAIHDYGESVIISGIDENKTYEEIVSEVKEAIDR